MGEGSSRRRRERSMSPPRRRRRERSRSLSPVGKGADRSRERDDRRHHERHRSRHSSRERYSSRERDRRRERSRERRSRERDRDRDRRRRSRSAARDRTGDVPPHGEGSRGGSGIPLSAYDAGRAAARERLAEAQVGGYDNRWDGDARPSRYESALASGLDGDVNGGPDGYDPFSAGQSEEPRPPATNTIFLKGVPFHKDENDIRALFQAWPNLVDVRLGRDGEGQSKGFAFLEFTHEDYARALMESPARHRIQFPDAQQHMTMEYSRGRPGGGAAWGGAGLLGPPPPDGGAALPGMDWLCDMCQATNFGRRLECHQCSTPRPANPRRVAIDLDEPSNVLKVSNLRDTLMQETLEVLFNAIAPVQSVRMVTDKFTGAPRGFCFAEFATIADAAKVLHTFNNRVVPEAQHAPLKLCYARPQPGGGGGGGQQRQQPAAPVPEALQAAMAMQAYSDWAPKEFDESALGAEAPQPTANGVAADSSTAAAATTTAAAGGAADAAAAAASADPQQASDQKEANFEYDPATGYLLDAASGLYYDANTGLYYDSKAQLWLAWDASANQYVPAEGQVAADADAVQPAASGPAAAGRVPSSDGTAALPGMEAYMPLPATAAEPASLAAMAPAAAGGPVASSSAAILGNPVPTKPAARRRGAVIGSAPQLSREGIQAALRQAEEKERQLKAAEAKKAAKARAAAATRKVAAAAPAAATAVAASAAAATPAAGQPLPRPGVVQGVVHRGKWAPKTSQA